VHSSGSSCGSIESNEHIRPEEYEFTDFPDTDYNTDANELEEEDDDRDSDAEPGESPLFIASGISLLV